MTNTHARGCTGKQRHDTEQAARAALRDLIDKGAWGATRNVYQCRWCAGWHVGNRPGSAGRRR